jgi:putative hydrolase of the HAD superfamily
VSRSRTWIFDLDNTLHNASPHIFPHINRAMTEYVQRELGLDVDAAGALRQQYWTRYGATLLGLMRHHGTDPKHFLWHTHQLPELDRMIVREPLLRATLRRLPGRKFVFSNAPVHYSHAVLKALAISDLFDAVFSRANEVQA